MPCNFCGGEQKRAFAPKFEDFCHRSGIHGFADIYIALMNRNYALLIFWTLVIVAACLFAVYGCYAIIMQYFTSPVVISYMIRPAIEGNLLPDIVVCPFSRFNQKFLDDHGIDRKLSDHIQSAYAFSTPYQYERKFRNFYLSIPPEFQQQSARLNDLLTSMGNISFEDFLKNASLPLSLE